MPQDRDEGDPRQTFPEQLQVLGYQLRPQEGGPREIATGSGEAGHEAVSDRVAHGGRDDGDRLGRLPCGAGRRGSEGHDEIGLEADELGSQIRKTLDVSVGGPVLDQDVVTLDMTTLA